jgi:hypothetical protein
MNEGSKTSLSPFINIGKGKPVLGTGKASRLFTSSQRAAGSYFIPKVIEKMKPWGS